MNDHPLRKPLRLPSYDYSSQGAYFVTICTAARRCFLDEERIILALTTAWRSAVTAGWEPQPHDFVVMPNHVHGIVWISGEREQDRLADRHWAQRSQARIELQCDMSAGPPDCRVIEGTAPLPGSLGALIRQFKSIGTQRIRRLTGRSGPIWQRGYYERVIRNESEVEIRRRYILDNPRRWAADPLNPKPPS
jgi:REP element-mobilizing transposase RayT